MLCLAVLALPFLIAHTYAQPSPNAPFTYNATHFLLHGEPYQIIGGQMDPQRIPPQYWRDRLRKARAMGLNTIFPYMFWNNLEPSPGEWAFDKPENDIATYFKIAQEEGLNIILRPGPYICGEHEWGGYPAWLSQVPGLVVRTYNEPYLNLSKIYLTKLAEQIAHLQVTQGGPILMVQVENEYGSYGENHDYIAALRDILKGLFDVPLYTNDGGVQFTLEGGSIPGVLAEIDGDPASGFKSRARYINDTSELGPLLDGEYYTYAPDFWGSYNSHNSTVRDPKAVDAFLSDIDYVLGNMSASISFYMVHGGTNWGFENGALWQNRTTAFTTSYDYSSPIDESGRTTELYNVMRKALARYVPEGSIPDVPPNAPRMAVPKFELTPLVSLFDSLDTFAKVVKDSPVSMEALGQAYGFILYEYTATTCVSGVIMPGDRPRDRVLVYLNHVRIGIIDSQYHHPLNVSVSLNPGDNLSLLVENLGRVDYHSRETYYADYLVDPEKGIVGDITVGGTALKGWEVYSIPLTKLPSSQNVHVAQNTSAPTFYHGTFSVPDALCDADDAELDTFLGVPAGIKGQVFVNGFNLGRYWLVGPQQSLYLPGTLLSRNTSNEIVVFELEPDQLNGTMVAEGSSERQWYNLPDPDCMSCI